jgi:acyl-CoA reductase-like NAD-dependent aldehyde dehydrogenase
MSTHTHRIGVRKTLKLFIGGQFPRSESGRWLPITSPDGALVTNISHASRKDLRDAVAAARKAQAGWAARTAFNRGQIVYRIAELLEARRATLEALIARLGGVDAAEAASEVDAAIDRVVWYAGWCDKFEQYAGAVNPVAAPFHNVSHSEGVGVVVLFAPSSTPLLGLCSALAPILASGSTVVASVDGAAAVLAVELAEVLATSDVPAGVVNLLTGPRAELLTWAGGHADVDAIALWDAKDDEARAVELAGADSLKRIRRHDGGDRAWWKSSAAQSPWHIADFTEIKTAWHPIAP